MSAFAFGQELPAHATALFNRCRIARAISSAIAKTSLILRSQRCDCRGGVLSSSEECCGADRRSVSWPATKRGRPWSGEDASHATPGLCGKSMSMIAQPVTAPHLRDDLAKSRIAVQRAGHRRLSGKKSLGIGVMDFERFAGVPNCLVFLRGRGSCESE